MKSSFPFFIFCVAIVLCGTAFPIQAGQQPQKIAILPLTAGGQENIDYIAEGLRDMIASRIASGSGLAVIDPAAVRAQYSGGGREAPSLEKVRGTGKALGADYVIFGSVAKMGNDLLIAIHMLSVSGGGAPFPIFSQTLGMNAVIPRLQLIAQEVRGAVQDGVLTPEEDLPSREAPAGKEQSGSAGAPAGGRVGPDPLTEPDKPVAPVVPAEDSGVNQAGEIRPEEEAAEAAYETEDAADEQEEGQGGLKNLLFKRKGDIKAPPENPAYEKSVDELQGAEKSQP
jgi:TolB-like protein